MNSTLRQLIGSRSGVRRGALIVLIAQATAMPTMYVAHLMLARGAGVDAYGVFRYAWSLFSIGALVACLGFPYVFQRFIPVYRSEGHPELATGLAVGSMRVVLLAAGAAWLTITLLARAGYLGETNALDVGLVVRTGWAILALAMLSIQTQLSRSLGRMAVGFVPFHLGRALAFVAAAVAVGVVAQDEAPMAALVAAGGVVALTVLVQGVWLRKVSGEVIRQRVRRYEWKRWLAVGLPLLAVSVPVVSPGQLGILVAGWTVGPAGTGTVGAAVQTALFITFVLQGVKMAAGPTLSRLFWEGRRDDLVRLMRRSTLASVVSGGVIAAGLIVFADPVMHLFGKGFGSGEGALVLRIVAVGGLVNAMTGPIGQLLNVAGQHRASAAVQITTSAAMVVLASYLGSRHGAVGIAAAIAGAQIVATGGLVLVARTRLGLPAPLWR